jgi:hypothetical protein
MSSTRTFRRLRMESGRVKAKLGGNQKKAFLGNLKQTLINRLTPPLSKPDQSDWKCLAFKHGLFVLIGHRAVRRAARSGRCSW